jgi:phospholipid/cholesterol/gamma-HCH transport system permease protein
MLALAPRSRCLPAIVPLSPKARGNIPPASRPNDGWCFGSRKGLGVAAGSRMEYISSAAHGYVGAEEKMVRSVADRAFLPAKSLFEQVGNMMILTGKAITATVRPPYPYGGEFISQFIFALQLCWFPMLISTVAFGFGAPGLQAANFASLFGALDRLGGFFVLASIREFAPFVTAVVVAGVAGTAITADLGARKIREELDALQVLGVDPIKNLVVPRFLALMLITGLLDIYALLFGIAGGVFATLAYHAPLGGFFATLLTNASVTELWGSILKTTLFGAIIAIVCSYKGMNASGGAAGVGRAVNEAVVIAFLGVFAFNYVFTQTLLATHPELQVPR